MKRACLLSLFWFGLAVLGALPITAQQNTHPTVTLYSPLKHQDDQSRGLIP